MTVIVIIGILAVMLLPALDGVRNRLEKAHCIENLHQLYLATDSYWQQNGHWPQIDPQLLANKSHEYEQAWVKILEPFGIAHSSWICPTVQRGYSNPDYNDPKFARTDYTAMPFDERQMTPHRWSTMPWFIEKGDVHGSGQLIIFADGSVKGAKDVQASGASQP